MQIEINYSPFSYQRDFHLDDTRFRCVVGGRRVGKSNAAIQELIRCCLSGPNKVCWWVSPTYRDAREVGFEQFLQYREALSPAIRSIQMTRLAVVFTNGSTIFFKGSDNPDSLRGRGLDMAVLDEGAFVHQDVWKKSLRPALSDKRGRGILLTTPNGKNWFHDQYKYSMIPEKKAWTGYRWPTSLSPLISDEDLAEAKDQLSKVDYQQEYEAEFITKAGLIYDNFSEENVIQEFIVDRIRHSFFMGIDFGYAGYTAACLFAVDNVTQEVTQFDELYVTRTDMDKVIVLLTHKLKTHKLKPSDISQVYTDPAGNAEELSSGLSPVDMMRRAKYQCTNKATRVIPGLSLVRSFICSASGKRRYFIHERCTETIRSINGYSYRLVFDQPVEEPVKDNIHDHACDALRYFFVNRFDNAKYVSDHLNTFDYLAKTKKKGIIKRCGICHMPFFSKTPKNEPPLTCEGCNDAN